LKSGDMNGYVSSVLAIMKRVLVFPAYTVAAVNGHAFGAGAQIALAHDARVMRTGRGYFCMPEIDMKAYLHPGMTAIIQARLPHQSAHELIVTACATRGARARAQDRRPDRSRGGAPAHRDRDGGRVRREGGSGHARAQARHVSRACSAALDAKLRRSGDAGPRHGRDLR
jgi:enoyl-CoA hydratase/carnithine racemase